jgi:nitroreductase
MRSRRSKRAYRDKKVERHVIEKVLEAARFAPSGHNEQSTEFVVVQDKKIIQEITALTAKGLARMAMPFRYAIGRMIMRLVLGQRGAAYVGELAPELEGLVDLYHNGTDIILREPPVLILFCADSVGGTFAATNANLAVHNAALAAETVGLGCFYPGFVVYVSGRDDRCGESPTCWGSVGPPCGAYPNKHLSCTLVLVGQGQGRGFPTSQSSPTGC